MLDPQPKSDKAAAWNNTVALLETITVWIKIHAEQSFLGRPTTLGGIRITY
jgi:hypothetical protein